MMQIDRPLRPEHITVTVGPPARTGATPIDVRSVRAAQSLMEYSARRTFASRSRHHQIIWPTVKVAWDGLRFSITGEVANG